MTLTPDERTRLHRLGLKHSEIDALDHLWSSPDALGPLLSVHAVRLHVDEWTLPDAYDALVHGLPEDDAEVLLRHGYTGHQIASIYQDLNAYENLSGSREDGHERDDILTSEAPRQFIVNVLRVAGSPEEADALLHRYLQAAAGHPVEPGDTPASVESSVELLAAFLPPVDIICDCHRK